MAFFETAERYSDDLRESMDRFLESRLRPFPEWAPAILRSHLEKIRRMCRSGGKMLRPALTCLFYEGLSGQNARNARESAFAFELFHNYTLIHDDIYDEDSERRGMPTVHAQFEREFFPEGSVSGQSPIYAGPANRYGAVQGIISGKLLFTFGLEALLESNLEWQTKERALRAYLETSLMDNVGQALDLEYESASDAEEAAYFELAILKTGRLIEASAAFGAILAQAPEAFIRTVRPYAENVAISFQIKDDLLDLWIWGRKGREIGSDVRQGKKTLPYTYFKKIRPDFRSDAVWNPKASHESVEAVISAMAESWAVREAERVGRLHMDRAIRDCEAFRESFHDEAYENLIEFTKYAWERKK